MTAPVPSPTPDEQAAEERKRRQRWLHAVWPNIVNDGSHHYTGGPAEEMADRLVALADSESADLRAALIVARERLAAVEALCDEWDNGVLYQRLAASDIRAALVGRPPTPHPTQEKP